jgi:hypothetical protein
VAKMFSRCEVREMQNAVTVLTIIRDPSRNGPLESYVIRKAVTRSLAEAVGKVATRVTRWRPTQPPAPFGAGERLRGPTYRYLKPFCAARLGG